MPLIFHIILALGLVHAVLLLIALAYKTPRNPFGFLCLMVAVFAMTGIIIEEWVVSSGVWQQFPHIIRVSVWMPFLIGPCIWGFVKSLEAPSFHPLYILHFLPAIGGALVYLPFYTLNADEKIDAVLAIHEIPIVASLLGGAKAISLFAYFISIRVKLRRRSSETPERKLILLSRWSINAIILFMLVIALGFSVEHYTPNLPLSSDLAGALGLGVFIFGFSLLSIMNWADFVQDRASAFETSPASASPGVKLLDDTSTEAVFAEIHNLIMASDMHKTPSLKLRDLANRTNIAPHYVSYVINTSTGYNFNRWINSLRVSGVIETLQKDPDSSLLAVAFDNGFNSKASFNRAFKAETGMSPSEFRNSRSHLIN